MVYQKPYTFRAGTYAKAAEVNANFDTVKNFIDDLQTDIADGFASTPAYNKANKGGSATQKFQVADGTATNDAVNKGQLDTVNTALSTRVSALEAAGTWTAPDYSSKTNVSGSGTFAVDGVLVVMSASGAGEQTITLGGTTLLCSSAAPTAYPIKAGTTYQIPASYMTYNYFFAS